MGITMQPSVIVAIVAIVAVLAPILAGVFAPSVHMKALIAFAVSGLMVTAVGVGILYLGFFTQMPGLPAPPRSSLLPAFIFLLWVYLGILIEILGASLTLASCIIGLRQTLRRQPRWYWILLARAILSLIVSVGIVVLSLGGPGMLGQVDLQIHRVSLLLMIAVALPLIAAVVALTYAIRRARGAHGQRAAAPLPATP